MADKSKTDNLKAFLYVAHNFAGNAIISEGNAVIIYSGFQVWRRVEYTSGGAFVTFVHAINFMT